LFDQSLNEPVAFDDGKSLEWRRSEIALVHSPTAQLQTEKLIAWIDVRAMEKSRLSNLRLFRCFAVSAAACGLILKTDF